MWGRAAVPTIVLAGALVQVEACTMTAFRCGQDSECGQPGSGGVCEANAYCSFPDPDCESGKRYGDLAGDGFAGVCVQADDGTGSTSAAPKTTTSTGLPETTSSTTTTGTVGSATLPLTSGDLGSSTGCETDCETKACSELRTGSPTGIYELAGTDGPYEAQCEMELGGGGWTLALVASDDGNATWTYGNRGLMTDANVTGDLKALDHDYKSPAAYSVSMTSLLFVHQPSGEWAAYHDVNPGRGPFTEWLSAAPALICGDDLEWSWALSDGTIEGGTANLCDARLYVNRGDLDGAAGCKTPIPGATVSNAFGPVWNRMNNDGCPFDDAADAGLGPEEPVPELEADGYGFGRALGLNSGTPGAAENYLQVFVR